jgi:hypothetical protein
MRGFYGASGRVALFVASLILGMLVPARLSFAQG